MHFAPLLHSDGLIDGLIEGGDPLYRTGYRFRSNLMSLLTDMPFINCDECLFICMLHPLFGFEGRILVLVSLLTFASFPIQCHNRVILPHIRTCSSIGQLSSYVIFMRHEKKKISNDQKGTQLEAKSYHKTLSWSYQ